MPFFDSKLIGCFAGVPGKDITQAVFAGRAPDKRRWCVHPWAAKVMTPASIRNTRKQVSWLLWPTFKGLLGTCALQRLQLVTYVHGSCQKTSTFEIKPSFSLPFLSPFLPKRPTKILVPLNTTIECLTFHHRRKYLPPSLRVLSENVASTLP